jgi:rSAM/selenodomain-associated transferase 2
MTLESPPAVSLVIPTLNEEENLKRLLPELLALTPVPQVIVSDGGSRDSTEAVALSFNAKLVRGVRGRGPQLNLAAEQAKGEVIVFLHADSSLPKTSYHRFLQTLNHSPELDGGAFRCSLAHSTGLWPRLYEYNVRLRSSLFNLPYGDQGFFLRRSKWSDRTRFAPWPLMEDVEWWQRLSTSHNLRILPLPLITSSRRFEQRGYFRSALRNLRTMIRYKQGVSPFTLAKEYHQ